MPIVGVYLDECVNHAVLPSLRQRGWRVTTAQAEGMGNASDDDQLQHATRNNWLLLTTNERHFVQWHTVFQERGWPHCGIATIPQRNSSRFFIRCAMMLDWIRIEFPDSRNMLFRWTDLQQRLNNGYFLDGYTGVEIALALGRTL
ncbi:MAG: DUF5615 family PIN-like protein [Thermomicrobiales bacterium]